ncbi:MAG: phenylalanine--tRNA ligase subunit beta [Fimbriimonadia bacterium]|jgi:phenylalanyl-tRNA synthetase beta chain
MLVTLEWLKEYVEFDLNANETATLLTLAGLEVEGIGDSDLGPVLDVKVTPNRGDCLSVVGLVREIIAKLADRCTPTSAWDDYRHGWAYGDEDGPHDCASHASVTIEAPELCPRYGARLVRGFSIGPSSELMQKRLAACGMRPISNIVDVTNYVLLELGQPLHAFDHDLLHGGCVVVRRARDGETITTIDGTEVSLTSEMLVICDEDHPVALAGVMGGAESEVTEATHNLLLESAHFDPVCIRRTSKTVGVKSESSYRFERSVDPGGVVTALNRACRLIERETGVAPVRGVIDVYPEGPKPRLIELDMARADLLLGMKVPLGDAMGYLTRLGLKVQPAGGGKLTVTVPERRPDLQREDDIIEEIGRVHGYEHIPDELPVGRTLLGRESPTTAFEEKLRDRLVALGLNEVICHSLRAPSPLDDAEPGDYVAPRTPAGPDLSVLRPTLIAGVAAAALYNLNRGILDISLFEIGRVFRRLNEGYEENKHLALFLCGRKEPVSWRIGEKGPHFGFFDAKGLVTALLETLGIRPAFAPRCDNRLHPGRAADILVGEQNLGYVGEIHPRLAERMDLPSGSQIAEFDVDALMAAAAGVSRFSPPPRFPAVRRDIAFEVPKSVSYASVELAVRECAGEVLEEVRLFDVYEGKGIAEGSHSLALALTLRKTDGTMTDEEANDVRERVFAGLEALGARRR